MSEINNVSDVTAQLAAMKGALQQKSNDLATTLSGIEGDITKIKEALREDENGNLTAVWDLAEDNESRIDDIQDIINDGKEYKIFDGVNAKASIQYNNIYKAIEFKFN